MFFQGMNQQKLCEAKTMDLLATSKDVMVPVVVYKEIVVWEFFTCPATSPDNYGSFLMPIVILMCT